MNRLHTTPPAGRGRRSMGIRCGIVGLPNVGKSTLFNALTRARHRGRELSVLHDRPERRRRAGARPAAGSARRDRTPAEDRADHGRVRGHRRPRRRRLAGRGTRQQVPGAHPRDGRDRARGALLRGRRRRARRGRVESGSRRRDHQHRAGARRPRYRRARLPARREAWRRRWTRTRCAGASRSSASAQHSSAAKPVRALPLDEFERERLRELHAADGQAGDVRRERRREGLHRQPASRASDDAGRGHRGRRGRAGVRGDRSRRSPSSTRAIARLSSRTSASPSRDSTASSAPATGCSAC